MKKLLASLAAFTALTAVASAADLPMRAVPPPVTFAPVPVFTWTGLYAGLNAGYGFDISHRAPSDPGYDGFTGGGQIGYNWQVTPGSGLVFGVEADAQYVDFGNTRNTIGAGGGVGAPRVDFFGTARGRAGVAFDRVLFYGTGGFAYAFGDDNRTLFNQNDDVRTGYTWGGGVEYALSSDSFLNFFRSDAVTMKVEGLVVTLDRRQRFGTLVPTVRDTEFGVVRAGLNYKFGSY